MSAALQVISRQERGADGGVQGDVVLRIAGGKPLRFHGELLAEGSSRRGGAAAWHEITIYRSDSGGIACGLRLRSPGGLAIETDRAAQFRTMDEATSWLEAFDPAGDLHAGFDVADPAITGAALAVQAASLRDRSDNLRRGYRALLGELLFQLEAQV